MPEDSPQSPSRPLECDLLVVGSGAAGLSAAVTAAAHGLTVVVVEKDPVMGGATAWSGGWMWVPRNPVSQADGIVEDAGFRARTSGTNSAAISTQRRSTRSSRPARGWSSSSSSTPRCSS